LHFPVSGISISRTLFFVPARIPQDSFGFLFFSGGIFSQEPPFGRGKKIPFSAMFTGIYPIPIFLHLTCNFSGFLQPPDSSGIPLEFLFPPTQNYRDFD
jgi:hypothetical protein